VPLVRFVPLVVTLRLAIAHELAERGSLLRAQVIAENLVEAV
jgi:hypothetical protein